MLGRNAVCGLGISNGLTTEHGGKKKKIAECGLGIADWKSVAAVCDRRRTALDNRFFLKYQAEEEISVSNAWVMRSALKWPILMPLCKL